MVFNELKIIFVFRKRYQIAKILHACAKLIWMSWYDVTTNLDRKPSKDDIYTSSTIMLIWMSWCDVTTNLDRKPSKDDIYASSIIMLIWMSWYDVTTRLVWKPSKDDIYTPSTIMLIWMSWYDVTTSLDRKPSKDDIYTSSTIISTAISRLRLIGMHKCKADVVEARQLGNALVPIHLRGENVLPYGCHLHCFHSRHS